MRRAPSFLLDERAGAQGGGDRGGLDPVETRLRGAYIEERQAVQLAGAMGLNVID